MASRWDEVRRPNLKVREKLSGLMRRGSSKSSKTSGHRGATTFTAPVLEVDLERVKSLRLADGWLEDVGPNSPSSPRSKRRDGRTARQGDDARESEREADERRYSKTPIADLFSMSTDQLASTLETISRKPVPAPAPAPVGLARTTSRREAAAEAPLPPEAEPQPIRISLRHSVVEVDTAVVPEPKGRASTESRRWSAMPWGSGMEAHPLASASTPDVASQGIPGSQRHSIRQVNLLRSVGTNTTGLRVSTGGGNPCVSGSGSGAADSAAKRSSVSSIPSPVVDFEMQLATRPPVPVLEVKTSVPPPRSTPTPTPTTSTSAVSDRRRSWQPARAPSPAPSTQGTGNASQPPRRTLSTRPPSAALTSSRLAWIRELESKSSPTSSPSDVQRLKNSGGGGVASKLAMFEHMKTQKAKQPPTLSRSNSTVSSRVSSGGTSLSLSGTGDISTARTSIDSDRTRSQRNSAVMAYYDEGFRERMEGVALQLTKKEKGEDEGVDQGLRKVTAQLVEVAKNKTGPADAGAAAGDEAAKAEEQPAVKLPEEAKEVSETSASELPAPAEEPSTVNVENPGPEAVEPAVPAVKVQPTRATDDEVVITAVEEPVVSDAHTDATEETKIEAERPASPSREFVEAETKDALEVTTEMTGASTEDLAEEANEEVAEVQIVQQAEDSKIAQGSSVVVEEV
ncbi:hypothetical protein OQA88_13434 [Cercophora sp. LCS_1]